MNQPRVVIPGFVRYLASVAGYVLSISAEAIVRSMYSLMAFIFEIDTLIQRRLVEAFHMYLCFDTVLLEYLQLKSGTRMMLGNKTEKIYIVMNVIS